jgi:hypothetical protein
MFKLDGGKLTFADIVLDGNKASASTTVVGGVIVFAATAKTTDTLVLDSGAIIQNSKSNTNGAAIYAVYGNIVMNDGAVIRDCYGVKGGAIYLGGGSGKDPTFATFKMTGGIITGGEAVDGGNIKINSGAAVTISGGTVTGGRSGDTGSGGNILVGAGTLTVTGGTIEKGWADKGGNIATMSSGSSMPLFLPEGVMRTSLSLILTLMLPPAETVRFLS